MNTPVWVNSAGVAVGAWLVACGAGWVMALALAVSGPRVQRLGWLAGAITLALPPFLPASCWLEWTAAWRTAMGPERALSAMLPFTAWVLGLGLWPLTLFFVSGAWQRLQPAVVEAEPWLRGWALWRWVLWPSAWAAMRLASVLTLTLALANFTVPTLFQVRVFTEEFWIRYSTQFDLPGAMTATWPLWVAPLLVGWVFRGRTVGWPREAQSISPALLASRLGRGWVWGVRMVGLLVVLLSLALPLVHLGFNPRTWTELPGALAAAKRATHNSWLASGMAALTILSVGVIMSRVASPSGVGWAARFFGAGARLGWCFFLLPGVFLAVGLIQAFNRPGWGGFYSSFAMVWVALSLRYFAPAWNALVAARRAMDSSLHDTARLLGAGRWDYFKLVTWPQSGRVLVAATYAVYLLCLWDVETLILIQPPGGETLALRIFNLLHYGHAAQVNALCVVTLALAAAPLGALAIFAVFRRGRPARFPGVVGVIVFGLAAMGVGGCTDSNAAGTEVRPLDSRLFSAAQVIGSRGVAPGQFNKPRSLACDREDNLYVADVTGRIQKFAPDGRYLLQWQMPQTDLGKSKGMGLDPAGNVLVVEPHYQRVNHFRGDGQLVMQWGRRGTNDGEFILPRCIAVNSAGEYYLGEYTVRERVQRFSVSADAASPTFPDGATHASALWLSTWGKPGQAQGDFNRAEGIAIGPGDQVYVADSCNHRIQVFDRDGRFQRTYGVAGTDPGQLSFPYDIRVERDGRQFVCEFGNSRISVYDAADHLVETVGRAGRSPGEFANPWAICLDSQGNLYVADSQNHRVQKLIRRPRTLAARSVPRSPATLARVRSPQPPIRAAQVW